MRSWGKKVFGLRDAFGSRDDSPGRPAEQDLMALIARAGTSYEPSSEAAESTPPDGLLEAITAEIPANPIPVTQISSIPFAGIGPDSHPDPDGDPDIVPKLVLDGATGDGLASAPSRGFPYLHPLLLAAAVLLALAVGTIALISGLGPGPVATDVLSLLPEPTFDAPSASPSVIPSAGTTSGAESPAPPTAREAPLFTATEKTLGASVETASANSDDRTLEGRRDHNRPAYDRPSYDPPVDDLSLFSHAEQPTPYDPDTSSFPLLVGADSYVRARQALARHTLPDPESVRVEEFLNAFDYGDPTPRYADFELTAEGAPSPIARGRHLLRFGITARDANPEDRPGVQLVLVVETPSARSWQVKFELMRRALDRLFEQLGPGDSVGLVVYGSTARILLRPTSDLDVVRGRLRQAFALAIPGGRADLEDGIRLGTELALDTFDATKTNRVLVCFDGRSPITTDVTTTLGPRLEIAKARGVRLSAVGFDAEQAVAAIDQLTALSGGSSFYVSVARQAGQRFAAALLDRRQIVAREATASVQFDASRVRSFRLISSTPSVGLAVGSADADSEDGGVEIDASSWVTALYEIELAGPNAPREALATLTLRYTTPSGVARDTSHRVLRRDLAASWQSATPSLHLSTVVAQFAATLGVDPPTAARDATWLQRGGRQLLVDYPRHGEVSELLEMLDAAAQLRTVRR